ncbi:MAG: hypothetical protein J6T18_01120 [Bacteroidaceae bacterium]|nr:hypothetical protein [Bacteroidaceae bacterium]MBO7588012.1 hypothetical protein [Bacteroidaceae bacterium]
MKTSRIIFSAIAAVLTAGFVSCSDMLKTESKVVVYDDDLTLDKATDTVYSVMGIVQKMQVIADRVVLLNEVRGDLVEVTDHATEDLRDIYNFNETTKNNRFNQIVDYYAVINNCNFFLSKVDTAYVRNHKNVFKREYVAVLAYRAWTYLQLATAYGRVRFFTKPILSGDEANTNFPYLDVKEIADSLKSELMLYVDEKVPMYGSLGGGENGDGTSSESHASQKLFIPIKLIVADLCLWSGDYKNAALYYHDYLSPAATASNKYPTTTSSVMWANTDFAERMKDSYAVQFGTNYDNTVITYIPMESQKYNGVTSELEDVFCSTKDNDYYYQLTRSNALTNLSAKQNFCYHDVNPNTHIAKYIYVDKDLQSNVLHKGDLRLSSILTEKTVTDQETARYNSSRQTLNKINKEKICLYRKDLVYLRLAEAMNRAGLPEMAFAVLKYGLCQWNIEDYISEEEQTFAKDNGMGDLLTWSTSYFMPAEIDYQVMSNQVDFTNNSYYNTIGIHTRGSGDAAVDTTYVLPQSTDKKDLIRKVEEMIVDEMALETCFEGYRFSDLYRVGMHRGEDNDMYCDDEYVAVHIAARDATSPDKNAEGFDMTLYNKLMRNSSGFDINPAFFLK